MDVTGRLSDAYFLGLIYPGTIVLTDNCTTAIRPAARDALSGMSSVLQASERSGQSNAHILCVSL